jgi:putative colanic acid biosynthesis acetyltransferase WcaF
LIQDLSTFRLPRGFRGRSAVVVLLWWLIQSTIFRWSPVFAYGFRRWLLRLFGATIGRKVLVFSTAAFTYPWKVTIGDYAWIGDDAVLYSVGEIEIGPNAVVSQASYLCAASHDYSRVDFPTFVGKITVGAEAWVAAKVFVAPGVTIGRGAVIGACSAVFEDMPEEMVCYGHPCRPVKRRQTSGKRVD